MLMVANRVADLTFEELREIIREEIEQARQKLSANIEDLRYSDLSDFPVDRYVPWPDDLSLHREDMYGDDGR
jgi:hypothetical protein